MNNRIDYLKEIKKMKVNRSGQTVSLHKPILLLLTISQIAQGGKNRFIYDDLENILTELLSKYGLRNTKRISPQYPFVYLASSAHIWLCSVNKQSLAHPDAASRSEVLGASAAFSPGFLDYLNRGENATDLIRFLLHSYWPESYHDDILSDLGVPLLNDVVNDSISTAEKTRSRQFVEEVLDAYERKCAVCAQSIRLGDALVGIDACHLKPIQHFGSDDITNGLALCKTHHWALDRGAYSINHEYKVIVSPKLNGAKMSDHFTSFENSAIFVPRNETKRLSIENIDYHNRYILFK